MNSAPGLQARTAGVDPLEALHILRTAGGALLVQAHLHGQLARVEWQEEKSRLLKMLGAALVGFSCLCCAMLSVGTLLLAATWETVYRLPAVAGLVVVYGIGTAAAWHRFQTWSALSGQSFAASLEELAADVAVLTRHT